MKTNITMQDIADQFGVSKVTVSKALNDKEGVSEELKNKIKLVAQEMGYRYNTIARSLKSNNTFNIGIIVAERFTDVDGTGAFSFYMSFYQQLTKTLDSYGYAGILNVLNLEDEKECRLPRFYFENKIDGFIVLGQVETKYIDALNETEMPLMFLDFYEERALMDSVISDNFYGSYDVTNYLVSKGHKNLGFVGNLYATSSIQDRFLGFYKSILEHKLVLLPENIVNDRDEQGRFVELKLPEKLPSAFVCNCDKVAYSLLQTLMLKGVRVPEDVSVVGFDNDFYATLMPCGLTTVEVNVAEMAKTVVECILKKMTQPDVKFGRITVKGNVVYRGSVKVKV